MDFFVLVLFNQKKDVIFIPSKRFSTEFERHDSFHKADCGNSEFYFTINIILLSNLYILEAIQKVQDNVTEVRNILVNEVKQDVNKSHGKEIIFSLRF